MSVPSLATRGRHHLAVLTLLVVAGCGGGDFAEQFVKLITARFVPAQATVAPGGILHVELEVSCDNAGLDTPFGRLGVRVKLDPSHTLAGGVTATPFGSPDADGFYPFACATPTSSPELRVGNVPVTISVAAGTPALTTRLEAYIEVEPLSPAPSKDSTSAQMTLTVGATAAPTPGAGLGGKP